MINSELKQEIQQAYSQFLKSKQLAPRYGQKLMIAEIVKSLAAIETDAEGVRSNQAGLCAIEAGTGTGKTVAYLLAVLPVAKALGKKVVVSTATVTLQEQIVERDLPDILRHSGLNFRFALAKGRRRYVCLSKLDQKLSGTALQDSLFEENEASSEDTQALYESLAKKLLTGKWSGDKDSWSEMLSDDLWLPLTADRNQCSGRRCQYVAQCAFFKARDNLASADCIVANHDLVMADLALGGGMILPAPEDTIYIFDEAHHLPDIALRHFAGQLRVNASLHWCDQASKQLHEISKNYGKFTELLEKLVSVPAGFVHLKPLYQKLKPLVESLAVDLLENLTGQEAQLPHYRFANGEIPEALQQIALQCVEQFQPLIDDLSELHTVIGKALENNHTGYSLAQIEALFSDVGTLLNNAEHQYGLWQAYSKKFEDVPDSRWIQLVESNGFIDFELSASPLLAAQALNQYLWHACYGAVLCSATLTALGKFDRLRMQSGLPKYANTAIMPSTFDYPNQAEFIVPALKYEPNHVKHAEELFELLGDLVDGHLGVLVLFASRRQLDEVYQLLNSDWRKKVLSQTQMSRPKMLELHKQRVDDGEQSILFGMASLAEGVDLPGKYCTHVIIDKLPFSVPSDPVSSALDEWLKAKGRSAFAEVSLPEVSQKLVQACGRLIRSESDSGKITLLDKRIITKRYGRQLLETLPNFKKQLADN